MTVSPMASAAVLLRCHGLQRPEVGEQQLHRRRLPRGAAAAGADEDVVDLDVAVQQAGRDQRGDGLEQLPEHVEQLRLAVGETVILLHPPLPLLGVSIGIKGGCHQNDSLADG